MDRPRQPDGIDRQRERVVAPPRRESATERRTRVLGEIDELLAEIDATLALPASA